MALDDCSKVTQSLAGERVSENLNCSTTEKFGYHNSRRHIVRR